MTEQIQTNLALKRRVLIVDDHVLFREGLISLLKYSPEFEVVGSAGSVAEAISQAFELQPDIILMDFTLSDGTGLDATKAILSKYPACKIVFLTVYEANSKLFAAMQQGAKGYILKNVPIEDLLASLRALERGETAMSRTLMGRILEEFSNSYTEKAEKTEKEEALRKLSQRELEVLKEMETGATNKVIGQRLFLSENTVKHHIRSILEKLSVETRFQAIEVARKGRLHN